MDKDRPNTVENKMGVAPIKQLLIEMSWPAILSMSIGALYNIVDSLFVSRISEDALTAVSIVHPLQMLIIAMAVGSGVGVNSYIARLLGAKKQGDADKAATTGIFIGILNYLIFLAAGIFVPELFVSQYADPGTEIYTQACVYLRIIFIGSFFTNVEIIIEKILQATGNMKAPMWCALTGAFVNIALDPILIFGLFGIPAMGVAGAAIATVFAQLCSLFVGTVILLKGEHLVNIHFHGFKLDWRIVKGIYVVGLPSIIMQSIASVMTVFYNAILVQYSTTAVAVLGVYFKLQSFAFMPVFGLNQGAMPLIGFNYGAKNKKRMIEAYKTALMIAVCIMALCVVLFQAIPATLLGIFDASANMLLIGVPALRIISINFIPAAFGIMNGCVFQATGHGLYSLICSVLRQLVGILPLAYLFAKIGGVAFSWWSFPCAEAIGLVYSFIMLKKLYNKEIKVL
ncbi:MAG: MATE family efflux transporter [Clostridia bacterium]|nr:MATE family efflux transporter [Clostridia bacterium]